MMYPFILLHPADIIPSWVMWAFIGAPYITLVLGVGYLIFFFVRKRFKK